MWEWHKAVTRKVQTRHKEKILCSESSQHRTDFLVIWLVPHICHYSRTIRTAPSRICFKFWLAPKWSDSWTRWSLKVTFNQTILSSMWCFAWKLNHFFFPGWEYDWCSPTLSVWGWPAVASFEVFVGWTSLAYIICCHETLKALEFFRLHFNEWNEFILVLSIHQMQTW